MKKFLVLFILLISFNSMATVVSRTEGTATGTSAQAIAADSERKYFLIQNKGSETIYLKFDSAHSGTEGIVIPAGGNYEPVKAPLNSVWLKSSTGSQSYVIFHGR
jgi:hypothetical protein